MWLRRCTATSLSNSAKLFLQSTSARKLHVAFYNMQVVLFSCLICCWWVPTLPTVQFGHFLTCAKKGPKCHEVFYHCAVFYFVTLAKSRINVSAEVSIKSMSSSGRQHLRWNQPDTKTHGVQCWCNLFIRCLTDGANPPGPPIHILLCSLHRTVNLAHGNLRQSASVSWYAVH